MDFTHSKGPLGTRYVKTYKVVLFILVFSLLCSIKWNGTNGVEASQLNNVVWEEPIQLSDPNIKAWSPAIVTDIAGNVHVMWSQTMTTYPPPGEGDTLFYSRWDGNVWSTPIDVLVSPGGEAAEFPDLAITPNGLLHAVWGTGGITSKLMYAHAPACCADDPRNWSQPVSLGGSVNLTTALVSDNKGHLHAAFASLDTGNIVYRRSDDGGETWPVWVNIPGKVSSKDDVPAYPRLAVDGRDRVHIVWSVLPWPGRYVMYSYSDDGGNKWSDPQIIDSYDNGTYLDGYGPIFIDVEAYGQDEIHLIWDGAPTVERNHIWSSDGGKNWSSRSLVFPISYVGRSGWNDMVVDSTGTLYSVALGQPWFASWSRSIWSVATDIGDANGKAEWVRIALSRGNLLHVVWSLIRGGETINSVWYVRGVTSSPPGENRILPTMLPTSTPAVVATNGTQSTSGSAKSIVSGPPDISGFQTTKQTKYTMANPLFAILVSLIPTLIILGVVFGTRYWWLTLRKKR